MLCSFAKDLVRLLRDRAVGKLALAKAVPGGFASNDVMIPSAWRGAECRKKKHHSAIGGIDCARNGRAETFRCNSFEND